jgi:hypothetical protein
MIDLFFSRAFFALSIALAVIWTPAPFTSASAFALKTLHSYRYTPDYPTCTDSNQPVTGLLKDESGNLFGTTALFGSRLGGTAFELTP